MPSNVKFAKFPRLKISAIVITMVILLSSGPGFSNTYTIYPTADASVYSASPEGAFGTETALDV